jgi:triphosphoribosyl-dephospho-CoA synthase
VEQCAILACLLEVSADKPGNVSRYYDFPETSYEDYLASAVAIGPPFRTLAIDPGYTVGECIYDALRASRTAQQGGNTHLGAILLLAPLVKAAAVSMENTRDRVVEQDFLRSSTANILASLTVQDAILAYKAINLAEPKGLTDVPELDVREPATLQELEKRNITLREWMRVGAEENSIAYEYITDYKLTFETALPVLLKTHEAAPINESVVQTYLELLSKRLDTLVLGKHGVRTAEWLQSRAQYILSKKGGALSEDGKRELSKFNYELHRKRINPGTTADLVVSALFVALIGGMTI